MSKNICAICFILLSASLSCQTPDHKRDLYKGQVMLKLPAGWTIAKEDYEKYVSKNVIYEIKISDSSSLSAIELKVYDSTHMYDRAITFDIIRHFKEIQMLTKSMKTNFIDSGIMHVNKISVGYIRYIFEDSDKSIHDGARMFFNTPQHNFFEIEIYNLNTHIQNFDVILNKIIKSLELNFATK